jgi:5-methyltetrahydropteroyltriglutamate--homocysteine methyltransferase
MIPRPDGRPPLRADHIGSLLRPAELRQAFRRHSQNEIGDEEFARVQDECIRAAVTMQEDVGLQVVTDGEFRRGSYWGRFVQRTDGFEIRGADFKFRDDAGDVVDFTGPYASRRIRRVRPLALDEFEFLRAVTRAMPKITLPAPSTMHFFRFSDFADRRVYADAEMFFADLSKVFQEEISELAAAGCGYIQLDEVALALLCDPAIRQAVEGVGADWHGLVDLYVRAINDCIARCPAEVVVGVHMCRGNLKGHYVGTGGYETIAERLFSGARVNHFLLEYDTPRAGDFAPLRFVPKNKGVVLGLVSSKVPTLEGIDLLRRRVQDASKFIDLDRLAISPQCGFASTVAGNPLTEADERAKLKLVVDASRAIWR